MLLGFVILYLVISIGIGMYAATRVHTARDYISAGRALPIYIVMAMVFATCSAPKPCSAFPPRSWKKTSPG
jgi:Na+/proline symporter